MDDGMRFPAPTKNPRGLLNEYECGCQVRRDASGGHFIHMCATHNAPWPPDPSQAQPDAIVDLFAGSCAIGFLDCSIIEFARGRQILHRSGVTQHPLRHPFAERPAPRRVRIMGTGQ